MNKSIRKFVAINLIFLVFVQIYCINMMSNDKNIRVSNTLDNSQKHKTLNEFCEELSCIIDKDIISANKRDDIWYIRIRISGDEEELLKDISKLENYDVSDYTINKKEDKCHIILEISARESV